MRKNKKSYADLGVYAVYEVKGLNQDRLINELSKNGIFLYNVKKYSNRNMRLSVSAAESKKFFAIADKMCYNIKKIHFEGKNYPFYFLIKNLGLFFGAAVFIFFALFANDFVFAIEICGSGKVLEREVRQYLCSEGIKTFTRFSEINLSALSDKILKSNDNLSFVGSTKNGNRLSIELVLAENSQKTQIGACDKIVSDYDGVIEEIKVYRGTAALSMGDKVKKGDTVVYGYVNIKEQTISVNPIAYVSILYEKTVQYVSDKDNQEQTAYIFALGESDTGYVQKYTVDKSFDGEKYIYNVKMSIRAKIYR